MNTTNTTKNKTTYGNLEITIEGIKQSELNTLLETITEKVASMGLVMVARSYITADDDYDALDNS